MKKRLVCKTKRMALDLNQSEAAKIIGVSQTSISKFELGDDLSQSTYERVVRGYDNLFRDLDIEDFLEACIMMSAYQMKEADTDVEKKIALNYLLLNISKLQIEISKRENLRAF